MYQIGDSIILSDGMQRFFNEAGPHLIIGRLGDQYIILGQNGWALKESDRLTYKIDKRYAQRPVWLIDQCNITTVIEEREIFKKCKTCFVVCGWGMIDVYGEFMCISCRKRGNKFQSMVN